MSEFLDNTALMVDSHGGGSRSVVLEDPKTHQALTVHLPRGRPVFARLLDEPGRKQRPGERTADFVLVAEKRDRRPAVCFVELKGTIKEDRADRAFEQIEDTAGRFCDVAGQPDPAKGVSPHHARWSCGLDLPAADGGRLDFSRGHDVCGLIITARGGTRHLPRLAMVAGRRFLIVPHQRHGIRGRAEIELDVLLDCCAS